MSAELPMDRLLREHYRSRADASFRDDALDRALARATSQRQRPLLVVAARGATMAGGRLVPRVDARRVAVLVALALLVVTLIVAALVGIQRPPPPPFGDGLFALSRDGSIVLAEPARDWELTVVEADGLQFLDPVWSPTGRLVAFHERAGRWHTFDVTTGETRPLGEFETVAWSPDGSRLVGGSRGVIHLTDVASRESRELFTSESRVAFESLAWSPDGRWLAATLDGELVLIGVATGNMTTLVSKGDADRVAASPSWAPDSSRVVFAHYDCTVGGLGCNEALAIVSLDGTSVTDITGYSDAAPGPRWSPDGAWIAYGSRPVEELTSADGLGGQSTFGLSLIRPDGTGERLIAQRVRQSRWGPGGKVLAYSVFGAFQEPASPIWVFDTASGRTEQLGLAATSFAWRPVDLGAPVAPPLPTTEPSVVASAAPDAPAAPADADPADPSGSASGIGFDTGCVVSAYEFATAAVREIAPEPGCPPNSQSSSVWAPDGSAIAVLIDNRSSVIARDGTILMDVDGGDAGVYLSWSSTGRFLLEATGSEPTRYSIVRPDGSGRVEIAGYASWSPDDSRVAFSDQSGHLFVGGGDGADPIQVGDFPGPVVKWSPDSTRLLTVKDGNAWIVAADGSGASQLTDFALGGATAATWSPDGRWIAVSQGTALWIVSPDGSAQRQLGVPDTATYPEPVWSPDGSRLAVAAWPAADGYFPTGSMPVYIVDVDSGSATTIEQAGGPVWSPDGRFLAVDDMANFESQEAIAVMNADGSGRHIIWSGDQGMGLTKAWLP